MATTNQVRDWWHLARCDNKPPTDHGFFGRHPVYAQNPDHSLALEMAHLGSGYVPSSDGYIGSKRQCPRGISGQPCQPNGDGCSLHNYLLAWDVEYNYNPHVHRRLTEQDLRDLHAQGKTKYTPEIVAAILSVKNTHGETLFAWLGYSLGDLMHWQLNVPPERQDVDWSTVPGYQGDTPMTFKDWANGMFDLFDDGEIDDLYDAGYIQGAADAPVYWKAMRDLGSEGRTLEQRTEVARFIQTSQVSAWLKAAQQ